MPKKPEFQGISHTQNSFPDFTSHPGKYDKRCLCDFFKNVLKIRDMQEEFKEVKIIPIL